MHFGSFDPSVLEPRRPAPRGRDDREPDRVRGVLRDGAARWPSTSRFHAARTRPASRLLVDVRGAHRRRPDVLGVAVRDPRRRPRAGIVLFIGWPARRRVWMAVAGVGFLVVIKLVSPGLLGTFFSLFQNAGRTAASSGAPTTTRRPRQLISQHLWLGRGIGTWYAPKHEVFDNQYLLTLVDSGVIGLVAFVGIVLAAMYAAVRVGLLCHRLRRAAGDRRDRPRPRPVARRVRRGRLPDLRDVRLRGVPDGVVPAVPAGRDRRRAAARSCSAEVAGEPADPYAIV